jgi:pimeloyl-ACP methyl ester carboxylesterase
VPGDPGSRDCVVIGHGVTSDKERPWSEYLSERLAERGVASMRIAWSGNGESGGSFADSTITKEVADLGAVLDALEDRWRVSYVGQSMGASVGMRRAARDPRIRRLVSLAGMVHTKQFMESFFGHLEIGQPMLGKPHCPLSAKLVEDLHRLDTLVTEAPRIAMPWLIVHGTLDDVVPIAHARDAHAKARDHAELVELEGVDHSFTGTGLAQMADVVVPWLCAP